MLEEFEKSVKATLYDRLASPLIGSYVTAWCVWNYKVILIIFSDLQYAQKAQCIDVLFAPWCSNGLARYGFPLLWSLFYIFLYPWISKKVFRIWQQYIKDKRDIKNEIEGTRLLTLAESEVIRTEYLQKENKIVELMQNKEKTIQDWKDKYNLLIDENRNLKERLEKYEPTPASLTDKVIPDKPKLSKEAYDILKQIVDSGSVNVFQIRTNMGRTFSAGSVKIPLDNRADMYIYELINNGFISQTNKDHYVLQTSGDEYVKNHPQSSSATLQA